MRNSSHEIYKIFYCRAGFKGQRSIFLFTWKKNKLLENLFSLRRIRHFSISCDVNDCRNKLSEVPNIFEIVVSGRIICKSLGFLYFKKHVYFFLFSFFCNLYFCMLYNLY